MRRRLFVLLLLVAAGSAGVYAYLNRRPAALVLTGIVTTNDVVVSPQVAGGSASMPSAMSRNVRAMRRGYLLFLLPLRR